MPNTNRTAEARLYKQAKDSAIDAMGGKRAFWIMGSTIRKAFVGQAILQTLALQDEGVSDARVRALLDAMWDLWSDDPELID